MTTATNGTNGRGNGRRSAPSPVAAVRQLWAGATGWFDRAQPQGGRRSRVVQDAYASLLDTLSLSSIVQPFTDAENWRTLDLDSKTLGRISATDLIEIMLRLSPEMNRAWWDFNRMFNPGSEVKVFRSGTKTEDRRGQAAVDALMEQLVARYKTTEVLHARLSTALFARGALLTELVLQRDGRTFADLYIADPKVARFRRRADPVLGSVWELGQYDRRGEFLSLEVPTVAYIPSDAMPDNPYGTPMVVAAVNPAITKLAVTNDGRRVLQQQGWPRIDMTIDLAQLAAALKATGSPAATDANLFWKEVEKRVTDFKAAYRVLEPDDAFVHSSDITVGAIVAAAQGQNLHGAEVLLDAALHALTLALKTQPILMASNEGTTETHANRQWEIHVAGIKSAQHLGEAMWEWALTLALNLQGIQAEVEFRYAELRAAEEMRDEQVRQLRNQNAAFEYWMGWDSQQETAEEITEHDPDMPEPRAIPAGWTQVGPLTSPVAADGGGGSVPAGGQPAQDATGNDGEQADDANVANADAGAGS